MGSCLLTHLKNQPLWVLAFFVLGILRLFTCAAAISIWVYVNFLRPPKNLREYGSWVVVTGPTDGIGKSLAFELARKGLNLVLVGRNRDKLKTISDSIMSQYPKTQIRSVEIDFSGDLDGGVKTLLKTIEDLDVGMLINNVGVSYPYPRYFHEVDEDLTNTLIKVNVEGTTKLIHAVLPGMVERKKGAIVNIGSGSAIALPSDPLYSVYTATKSYVDHLSRSLYVEYKKMGIDVQCQVPLYVATKMASIRKSSFFVPSPETYARASLRHVGYEPRSSPHWPHTLVEVVLKWIPECALDAWRLSFCSRIRKRGQLKEARMKAE